MTPAEFRALGEKLYGPCWQTSMSEQLPANTRTIRRWLSGERKIRPLVEARIRSLQAEAPGQQSGR